jgi:hypothetical protein
VPASAGVRSSDRRFVPRASSRASLSFFRQISRMRALQAFGKHIGPPLAVFVLARLLLAHAASLAHQNPWTAQAWSRWDSAHYLAIAKSGYEFFSCARVPGYNPAHFCGNTGWLPAFPLLIRGLCSLGMDPLSAGDLIAGVFALATLVLLWNAFIGPETSVSSILTLCLAGFFPGNVYEHALFPVSLCAFFQVLALRAHSSRRFVWAGLAGGVAAFAYGSGLFMAGVFGLHILLRDRGERLLEQVRRIALESGLVALGFGAVMLVQWCEVHVWNGYFAVQAKYGYGATSPLKTLWPHFDAFLRGRANIQNAQTVFVTGLAVLLTYAAFRRPRLSTDGVLLLFFLCYWLVPLSLGGSLSLYRAEAVLLPAIPLAKKLPVPVLCVLVFVAIAISLRMGTLFFNRTLV